MSFDSRVSVSSSALLALACGFACSSPEGSGAMALAPFQGELGALGDGAGASESTAGDDGSAQGAAEEGAGAGDEGATAGGSDADASGSDASNAPATGSEQGPTPGELAPPVVAPMGPAPAQPCASKVRVQSPLIVDFETYTGTLSATQFTFYFGTGAPNGGALGGLFSFDDLTGTNTRLRMVAGRTGGWGASFQIEQASQWGGGTGLWFGCVDASAYSGISFWVRGATATGAFSVTAGFLPSTPADPADPAGGGACTGAAEGCLSPALAEVPLTLDWTLVEIPWSSLEPGLIDGVPFVPSGDELTGLTFGLPIAWGPDPAFVDNPNDPNDTPEFFPLPSDIILQFDDVRFLP